MSPESAATLIKTEREVPAAGEGRAVKVTVDVRCASVPPVTSSTVDTEAIIAPAHNTTTNKRTENSH